MHLVNLVEFTHQRFTHDSVFARELRLSFGDYGGKFCGGSSAFPLTCMISHFRLVGGLPDMSLYDQDLIKRYPHDGGRGSAGTFWPFPHLCGYDLSTSGDITDDAAK